MGANARTKGAEGEREIIRMLNPIIVSVMKDMNYPEKQIVQALSMVQRNQNQSAVGGNDLTNTFGLSIEVKRQETLSLNTWWLQTLKAAERNNELPVLIYRQSRKPWRVRTYGFLHTPSERGWSSIRAVVEFDEASFRTWFYEWVKGSLEKGYEIRI